jgi:glucan phosphorylase
MNEAIESGDVELMTTPIGRWFWRHELMSKALETWPLHVIEEALGNDADSVLPQAIRTKELRVRLPRHHVDMLEYRAGQERTTVSGVLARELDGIASAHAEELSAAIPGFAEALAWPEAEQTMAPC